MVYLIRFEIKYVSKWLVFDKREWGISFYLGFDEVQR